MHPYLIVLALIWLHVISDFILQSDKMATSKSKSNKWLTIHVSVYSILFLIFFGPLYAAVNFIAHWFTDWVSSRITSRLWAEKKVHWFFVVIGIDQAIHASCLLLTIPLMGWSKLLI